MTPTHTTRRGRRYRYYVSNRLVAGKETAGDAGGWRLPAPVLEGAVAGVVAEHIETMARRQALLADPDARTAGAVKAKAETVCSRLRGGDERLLRDLIASGEIGAGRIGITLAPVPLAAALGIQSAAIAADALTITAPFERRRRGIEARIVAGGQEPQTDPALMRRLADAHRWVGQLRAGVSLSSVSCQAGHSDAYIRTRAQLAFLSPRIQAAIIAGTQPPEFCLERILRTGVPLDWSDQERVFGIGGQAP